MAKEKLGYLWSVTTPLLTHLLLKTSWQQKNADMNTHGIWKKNTHNYATSDTAFPELKNKITKQ